MAYSTLPAKVAGDVFTEAMWTNIKDNFTAMRADGTAAAPAVTFDSDTDTGLYNVGANRLGFTTAGTKALEIAADGKVLFGNSTDTNLYRSAANTLQTDDFFRSSRPGTTSYALATLVDADAGHRLLIQADGKMSWGDGTGLVGDTNLYRGAADTLQTDDRIIVSRAATTDQSTSYKISTDTTGFRHIVLADGKHQWGDGTGTGDTNLYRSAADTLKTDDDLIIGGGGLTLGTVDITGAWTDYTPTWAGTGGTPAVGTGGSLKGRYMQVGKTVTFKIHMILGSSPTVSGISAWTFTLPKTAATTETQAVVARAYDDNVTTTYVGVGLIPSAGTTVSSVRFHSGTSATGSLVPMTWAQNDILTIQGTYEIA